MILNEQKSAQEAPQTFSSREDDQGQSTIMTKESYPVLTPNYQTNWHLQFTKSPGGVISNYNSSRSYDSYSSRSNSIKNAGSKQKPLISCEVKTK